MRHELYTTFLALPKKRSNLEIRGESKFSWHASICWTQLGKTSSATLTAFTGRDSLSVLVYKINPLSCVIGICHLKLKLDVHLSHLS